MIVSRIHAIASKLLRRAEELEGIAQEVSELERALEAMRGQIDDYRTEKERLSELLTASGRRAVGLETACLRALDDLNRGSVAAARSTLEGALEHRSVALDGAPLAPT